VQFIIFKMEKVHVKPAPGKWRRRSRSKCKLHRWGVAGKGRTRRRK